MSSTVAAILQRAVDGGRLTFDDGVDPVPIGRPARPRPRRRRGLPAAPPRAVPHLQHRPQHQLHQRLHGGLRLLRLLPQGRRHRSLRARPRRAAREDPRDRRAGRRPDPDAGGLHPHLKLEWYEELLRDIKAHFPEVNIHGFSPPEIHHFTKVSKLPLADGARAAQGRRPGEPARRRRARSWSIACARTITRGKVLTDDWLNVHRVWHELGGRSTATMMFGHIETLEERIEHLERVRQLQDETGGFTAFISWTFQPDHTDMADVPPAGAFEYLKTQAISRLYLDNVPNIQSSWVTQGAKIGQLGLYFGANDMGSLMIEENVVSSAGTVHHLTLDQIKRAIREAGLHPPPAERLLRIHRRRLQIWRPSPAAGWRSCLTRCTGGAWLGDADSAGWLINRQSPSMHEAGGGLHGPCSTDRATA